MTPASEWIYRIENRLKMENGEKKWRKEGGKKE